MHKHPEYGCPHTYHIPQNSPLSDFSTLYGMTSICVVIFYLIVVYKQ